MNAIVNPFEGQSPRAPSNAVAQSDQQRQIAEVQAALMIARMNPRDPIVAMDRILNSCARQGLAESALYSYARGGSNITGPSIRLAEAMAQAWGNMQFGIRELEQRNGESTVQAFAWDVETNTRREVTFQVSHIRQTKTDRKLLTDPRDIYEMVANQGARRLRACILAVIPGDVTEAAVNQCEVTMKSKADTSPEAMLKMVEAFGAFGVTKDQLEKRIQRRLDAIQPAQVVNLKKIYASLRDGMSVAADWFEGAEADPGDQSHAEELKSKIKGKAGKQQTAAKEQPAAKEPATTTAASDAASGPTVTEIMDKIKNAKTLDDLDATADLIGEIGDEGQRLDLQQEYELRRGEIQ